jgi:hypothetical protein
MDGLDIARHGFLDTHGVHFSVLHFGDETFN